MDRTREARSSAMVASNGLSRRKQISTDDGHAEIMQNEVRFRDWPEQKRDRVSLCRSKRRRSERFMLRSEGDVEEDSSDENLRDEDVQVSQNWVSFQHNYLRKSFGMAPAPRYGTVTKTGTGPLLQVADDMIGVSVPKKARSACIKRAHDSRTSSGSGGGEDNWRPPASPASYIFKPASPSSSTVSIKRKMNANGSTSHLPTPLKSSGTAEDDLEIEIAEVLSRLKKQPRSSKKEDELEKPQKSIELSNWKTVKAEDDDRSVNIEITVPQTEKSSIAMETQSESQKQEQPSSPNCIEEKSHVPILTKSGGDESRLSDTHNKFEIDLMVHPPISHSPERDLVHPLTYDPIPIPQDHKKQPESSLKNKETIMGPTHDWLKLEVDQASEVNVTESGQRQQEKGKSGIASALPTFDCCSNGISPESQLDTVKPSEGIRGSSQSKRCATHYFIARNIRLHQQLIKPDHVWVPHLGSVSEDSSLIHGSQSSLQQKKPQLQAVTQSVPSESIAPTKKSSCEAASSNAVRGGASCLNLSFTNGFLYSPQMLQPPQLQQGQGQKEIHNTSNGSSSSSSSSLSSRKQMQPRVGNSSPLILCMGNEKIENKTRGDHTKKRPYSQQQNFSVSFGSINVEGPQRNTPVIQNGKTLVFDQSTTTLNFGSGGWPPRGVTPATATMNSYRSKVMKANASRQTQISFAVAPKPVLGHKSPPVVAAAAGNKTRASSVIQMQPEMENSAAGSSSPICGRNVRPIIGHHLSELKY